jgi:hypothetical protein
MRSFCSISRGARSCKTRAIAIPTRADREPPLFPPLFCYNHQGLYIGVVKTVNSLTNRYSLQCPLDAESTSHAAASIA